MSSAMIATHNRFLEMLREELDGDEQEMFVHSFHMFLKYDPYTDFVIDLGMAYEWAGFAQKSNAKVSMVKNLVKDVDYTITPVPGVNKEIIMMTVDGYKRLCLSANTTKGKTFHSYFINMERIMMKLLRQNAEEQRIRADEQSMLAITTQAQLDQERKEKERLALELEQFRSKTYEEILKDETVYIHKERVQLGSNKHKVGFSTDTKKRESAFNTGSAEGGMMIYKRKTHNGRLVESIVKDALKRYHIGNIGGTEHYNCDVEHTALIFNLACAMTDTFASSYDPIGSDSLIDKLIEKINAERVSQYAINEPPPVPQMEQGAATSQDASNTNETFLNWLKQEIEITDDKDNDRVAFSKDFQKNNMLPAFKKVDKDTKLTIVAMMKVVKDYLQPQGLWKDAATVNSKPCVNVGCGIKVSW